MEIEYVPVELRKKADALGFRLDTFIVNDGAIVPKEGNTLEQLERWIWKEHRELFPFIRVNGRVRSDLSWTVFERNGNFICTDSDPFTARLAGVERVIEILEQQSKRKEK